ncbi:MAG: hypothetical protein D6811_12515 [Alphaproteobacteria bacterium]|nr:MAG: hypothetical protein D6811_12515 [Alphaproteobacteria bacterium]
MLTREHELHRRRARRNMWVALSLGAFVLLVAAITMVKMSQGESMEAFDHVLRPSLLPAEEAQ